MNSKLAFTKKQRTKRTSRKLRNVKRKLKNRKPVKDLSKVNKKRLRKQGNGAFGGIETRDFGDYKTLRVLHRSKRTKDNCNKNGILKD